MSLVTFNEELQQHRRQATLLSVRPLFLAIVSMAFILLSTVFFVVIKPFTEEKPQFISKKTIFLPQRELEHQIALSEFQSAAAPPLLSERLQSTALIPNALPVMPDLPTVDFSPLETESPIVSLEGIMGTAGMLGGLGGLKIEPSKISMLGISDEAERFVIAFDISTSVVNNMSKAGMDITRVREETAKVIQKLNANTLFGMVQFSRNYDTFKEYLVPATKENKEAALQWLQNEFVTTGSSQPGWTRGNPNGIQSVMRKVFEMQPDAIILVSDASFQRSADGSQFGQDVPWDELADNIEAYQKTLPAAASIHFVGFGVNSDNAKEMRRLARNNNGKYKDF